MDQQTNSEISIRSPKDTDLNFILASFNKSVRKYSILGKSTKSTTFFTEFPKIVDHILDTSEVLIAHPTSELDIILGYMIYRQDLDLIHYIYVKEAFQKIGIGKKLVQAAFPSNVSIDFTINTDDSKSICKKHQILNHNPFHLYLNKGT